MSTIAAISTPIGQGGIGIIRISGEKSLEIINKIFKNNRKNKEFTSYSIRYGHVYDGNELVDEVLVSYFKAPNSYTGEDVCEINCHGGNLVVKRILEIVIKNGAELAMPGEFTKRAFLNGKLDLSQAEAVMDVINSKSIKENKISMQQLDGYLGRKISEIKGKIIDILVDIEANIDYPEYDIEEVQRTKINTVLENAVQDLDVLEKTFDEGKILKEGINTVIIGRPNVGKSSLLNALLKEDRAIVTSVAGTTRDTIEETLTIKGIPLKIVDTAGIRETNDIVEGIGVEKSKKALENADLVLFLLDSTEEISEEDVTLLKLVENKNYIVLINKIDIGTKINKEQVEQIVSNNNEKNAKIVEISAQKEIGLVELENTIEEMFNLSKIDINNEIVITNARHKNAINKAKEEIKNVLTSNKMEIPIDMLSIDLQNALQHLGEITGETVSEDVINEIFKKFCLGK
ncbi:MAG: tRNA uridine-5-carboxymethylaminomethyl(34) synthesis GTPase MnmE [Clostridia bacterium]|nr:tRNA uridine-5-carboxymethylaminomethyl(34) synthesis GTPase MnmE [Clostridia bacterium]